MEHGLASGERVKVSEVTRRLDVAVRSCRDSILSVPARTAAIVANLNDPAEIEKLVRAELAEAIDEFEKSCARSADSR